jgi:hypothetical protein
MEIRLLLLALICIHASCWAFAEQYGSYLFLFIHFKCYFEMLLWFLIGWRWLLIPWSNGLACC